MTTAEPNSSASQAIKALMDASPDFQAALESAAKTIAEFMEVVSNNPEMQEALKAAGAKVAAIEQAARKKS